MTIYVDDPLFWRGKQLYCHMFTDGDMAELHDFARRIGLKRCWFSNPRPGDHPHYDCSSSYRMAALDHGAVYKSGRDWVRDIVIPSRGKKK